jgi:predicted GIY-YIG superfamily endonuclease
MSRTAVYRFYDADDVCLYVGMSQAPWQRAAAHQRSKATWAKDVVRLELKWLDTRAEAAAEEVRLIAAARPIHNKASIIPQASTTAVESELIAQIVNWCTENGVPVSIFGHLAINDRNLLTNLQDGRELRRKTVQRIHDFMADRRGQDADVVKLVSGAA